VGVHDNIHIPRESMPNWIWYIIEVAIVIAASMIIAHVITDTLIETVAISIYSEKFLTLPNEIQAEIASFLNWIYYGIVGAVFFGWYFIIRTLILKKPILENRF
jgi:hypothetical protein